jgi:UDPglucose 6-dehydrogenase
VRGADAAVIATEWPEFQELDWAAMGAAMRQPLVFDGRRLLDGPRLRDLGFRYEAVGSSSSEPRSALNVPAAALAD